MKKLYSIKYVTSLIFALLGLVCIVLSLIAGDYFKQAAIKAQTKNLSRIIEVASHEVISQIREQSYKLGSKISNDKNLHRLIQTDNLSSKKNELPEFLDDPLLNGFVGFSKIDLKKLRVFDLNFQLFAESSAGTSDLTRELNPYLKNKMQNRQGLDRLKAIDAIWISSSGPMFTTLIPIGGLRPLGYLEITVDPVFNLESISEIIQAPITISSYASSSVKTDKTDIPENTVPVEYILNTTQGIPALSIVGYENITQMSEEMDTALLKTIVGFLSLSILALLFVLWLLKRLLFAPMNKMIADINQITHGNIYQKVSPEGLSEFRLLAKAFNAMTRRVRNRTDDLQKLLDINENALMCFGDGYEIIYFNKKMLSVFGYREEQVKKLYLKDFFTDDLEPVLQALERDDSGMASQEIIVNCKHHDGTLFQCIANIKTADIMHQHGLVISVGNEEASEGDIHHKKSELLSAVEKVFSADIETEDDENVPSSPQRIPNITTILAMPLQQRRSYIRSYVVKIMNLALLCWTQQVGKSKIELAEESGIWPVYIDKSTPTTRTLDKYLSLDHCPKNPRSQRVIETAEFVIKQTYDDDNENIRKLGDLLKEFRTLLAGMQ